MTPKALAQALASPDVAAVRAAVRACGETLRSDDIGEDRRGLADVLLTLVSHPVPEVREDLANLCDALPDPFFERCLEALCADADGFVKNAAKRAGAKRARRREESDAEQERDELQGELLDAIEAGPGGAPARRLAERAVRRGVEHHVARLDHELRKQRGTIERSLALLSGEIEKKDGSRAQMQRLVRDVEKTFALVASIAERARAYAAPVKPIFREERVADVLEDARRQLFDRTRDAEARIDFGLEVEPGLVAEVDRCALLQALQNLLQNAVEAYGKPARAERCVVRVAARTIVAGSEIEIVIADRGRGMSEEQRTKLFVPFGSTKPGGTGLGMLIARKMIKDAHAGELRVESKVGEGTTVTVRVPVLQKG